MARLPAVFFGHGSPLNALDDNPYTRAWAALGTEVPRPRAILAISAHWYVRGTHVTAMTYPPTIHDFGGFPRALHTYSYPARGSPAFAMEVARLLAPSDVGLDQRWGLDHGTWSVLTHVYPQADIPVVQLSIDADAAPSFHFTAGARLARLRDDGVFIIGTGNVVHNLAAMRGGGPTNDDWAARFEARVRSLIEAGDVTALTHFPDEDRDAARAVPTPEHYLPLLYVLGTRDQREAVTFPTSGIVLDAISMLSVRVG